MSIIITASCKRVLFLEEVVNSRLYNFGYMICQKVYCVRIGIITSYLFAISELIFDLGQAHTFFSQLFNLSNDGKVFEVVTPLLPTGSDRDDNAIQFFFPESEGRFRNIELKTELLDCEKLFL